ncbi:hypothetical protein QFC24_004051 [Naganishia onofrii]|uniref:Uncharacterized protein n=1 Tax=Naganishia onofrii TaxID=1851511 RepID=A0ACC2XIA7_9TREE|nr:hypothetical protein QFC24_004051 [Naganishia onofrii]
MATRTTRNSQHDGLAVSAEQAAHNQAEALLHLTEEVRELQRELKKSRKEIDKSVDTKVEAMNSELQEALKATVGSELEEQLGGADVLQRLKDKLARASADSGDDEADAEHGKRKRDPHPRNVKLQVCAACDHVESGRAHYFVILPQDLVHYHFHALLKKPHAKSAHWPDLPAIRDQLGCTHHWPKPGSPTTTNAIVLLIDDVIEENRIVATAAKTGDSVKWPMVPSAQSTSVVEPSGAGATSADPSLGSSGPQPPIAVDTRLSIRVWRPDFADPKALS